MYQAVILPLAIQDIYEAAKWYDEQQAGLGFRFIKQVRKKVAFISKKPKTKAVRYDNIRTAVLDVFPYMIHFAVDDDKKLIVISAVLSTHREPGIWKGRD